MLQQLADEEAADLEAEEEDHVRNQRTHDVADAAPQFVLANEVELGRVSTPLGRSRPGSIKHEPGRSSLEGRSSMEGKGWKEVA